MPSSSDEEDAFWALAWLEENYDVAGSIALGAGFNTWGGLVSQSHNSFIEEVKVLWGQYQQGAISKNQYDYCRQVALNKYAAKIGPFEKLLFKGKTGKEAVRISRSKAIPATAKIDNQLFRLGRMARYAKHGGIILTAASVGMACSEIGNAHTRQTKNEIFVETLVGGVTGLAGAALLTLYFTITPTGWLTALVLGAGAALGSYGAGQGRYMYMTKLLSSMILSK